MHLIWMKDPAPLQKADLLWQGHLLSFSWNRTNSTRAFISASVHDPAVSRLAGGDRIFLQGHTLTQSSPLRWSLRGCVGWSPSGTLQERFWSRHHLPEKCRLSGLRWVCTRVYGERDLIKKRAQPLLDRTLAEEDSPSLAEEIPSKAMDSTSCKLL